jgi:hypothetical protein
LNIFHPVLPGLQALRFRGKKRKEKNQQTNKNRLANRQMHQVLESRGNSVNMFKGRATHSPGAGTLNVKLVEPSELANVTVYSPACTVMALM